MFKKTIIVTLAFLNFSLPAIAEREDMQIAQKKQLLQYISNEETALKAEIASYEGLSNMLKNVRKDGKIYYIIFTSSILSTLSIGTVVGGYGAYVANGGAVKPAKLVFKIAGAVIPILLVSAGISDYKAELTEAELENIQTQLSVAEQNVEVRRNGLVSLKKQLGIDTKNIDVNGAGTGSSTLFVR